MSVPPERLRPLLGRPDFSGSPRTFEFLVAGAGDTDGLRDLANAALRRFEQVLHSELDLPIYFSIWDYREATPTTIPRGTLSATSLAAVDRSSAVIALIYRRWGDITSQEIRRSLERRQRSADIDTAVFVHPRELSKRHERFFEELGQTFEYEISWGPYTTQLEFQARFDAWLFRFLFERLTTSNPALISGEAA